MTPTAARPEALADELPASGGKVASIHTGSVVSHRIIKVPTTPLKLAAAKLEVRSLSCARGDKTLFKDVNFELLPGRPCQIVGANGSGKTTLLRTLCGLTLPTAGEILWGGQSIGAVQHEYWSAITYIGHAAGIKLDLTALENLQFDRELSASAMASDMESVLERLDLEACADLPCRQLSAGQRRRVALGKLLTRDAAVWLLDEPFTSIDQNGVETLTRIMDEHLAAGGILAFATHQAVAFRDLDVQQLRLGE